MQRNNYNVTSGLKPQPEEFNLHKIILQLRPKIITKLATAKTKANDNETMHKQKLEQSI